MTGGRDVAIDWSPDPAWEAARPERLQKRKKLRKQMRCACCENNIIGHGSLLIVEGDTGSDHFREEFVPGDRLCFFCWMDFFPELQERFEWGHHA